MTTPFRKPRTKMPALSRHPKTVRAYVGSKRRRIYGWYYESEGSIEILLHDPADPSETRRCRITRAQMKDYIRRTDLRRHARGLKP